MKKHHKNLQTSWIKSAAGKISLSLLCSSMILLIVAFSSWGNLSKDVANNVNNILIGLATNLMGIIITISFVQYFIDKQDTKQAEAKEIETIIGYDRLMSVLIERYIKFFNCVTVPIGERRESDPPILNNNFPFENMCDMYELSPYLSDGFLDPSITLFYKAEENLRNYMIRMVEGGQFKYNDKLKDVIITFIEKSLAYDTRSAILGNINICMGDKNMIKVIQEYIKDSSQNWVEKAHTGDLGPNFMLSYVQLFDLLKIEVDLIKQYKYYLEKLSNI